MPIVVELDVVLAKKKMKARKLAEEIGVSEVNISLLRTGKVQGIRFSTLNAICRALGCQPGDILKYVPEDSET